MNPDVVLTSTYVSDDDPEARTYGRVGNPTWESFEAALSALEGGAALTFASGMAAVSAVVHLVPPGGRVVAPDSAYNTTLALLDGLAGQGRLSVTRVDVADTGAVGAAVDGAAMLWLESPTNPLLDVADVRACSDAARSAGALTVVDNTFATPLLQRPLELGADLVVHSVTKYLSGHSDVVLGAVVGRRDDVLEQVRLHRTVHGAVAGPWEVWLALRGLRTLPVRLDRACANAAELSRRLATHPAIERVRYPGWGAMVAVEVAGGAAGADAVTGAVRLWVPATSLGGVESTLERRRRHRTEPVVVPESLLRLSVGVEDVDDLWADLEQALGGEGRASPG